MKHIFVFALSILTLSSCKKEDEQASPPTAGPSETTYTYSYLDTSVANLKFQPGTYWVYENDSTGVLDSIVVDSVRADFFWVLDSHLPPSNHKTQIYIMRIHDFGNSRYYSESLVDKTLYRSFSPYGAMYGPLHFNGRMMYMADSPAGTDLLDAEITEKIPSMNLFTNTFYNVSKVLNNPDDSVGYIEFPFTTAQYYSDSLGLIKKEIFVSLSETESWSLKRWNIVR